MKTILKRGNPVYYGVIRGVVIGIFADHEACANDRAIFMSFEPRYGFKEIGNIYQDIPHSWRSAVPRWLYSYFGTDDLNFLQDKKKFLVVQLSDLKTDERQEPNYKTFINKRHLLIKMARFYIKQQKPTEDIHRLCERIENMQQEIEEMEGLARRHLTPV